MTCREIAEIGTALLPEDCALASLAHNLRAQQFIRIHYQ